MAKAEIEACPPCDNRDICDTAAGRAVKLAGDGVMAKAGIEAGTSRDEIEEALDNVARNWLGDIGKKSAIPGWNVLTGVGFAGVTIGGAHIPVLDERKAAWLVKLAETSADAFDAACHYSGMAVLIDEAIENGLTEETGTFPPSLRRFAARVLTGDLKRPARKGRCRVNDVPLRAYQYGLCWQVSRLAPLPLTRNRQPSGPASFTACDAVAEAFTRAGHNTSYEKMASLCYDAAHSEIRAFAEMLGWLNSPDNWAT